MSSFLSVVVPVLLTFLGVGIGSLRIINEGNEALVERLGQYQKKLNPGLNFIIPIFDTIVVEETTREKVLDIDPQSAITKDNVSLQAGAVIYWQIIDLEKTFYAVEDIEAAIENMVLTALRSAIGQLELEETYSSRKQVNQTLLRELDEATANWGVKIIRVEVREIKPAQTVMDSLEQERAAESKKRAEILETEGKVSSIKMLSEALNLDPSSQEFLNYMLAQGYVDANAKLGNSPNSKVVFMDPKALRSSLRHLMDEDDDEDID